MPVTIFQNNVLEAMSVPVSVTAMVDKNSTCWFLTKQFAFLQQCLTDIFIMFSRHEKAMHNCLLVTKRFYSSVLSAVSMFYYSHLSVFLEIKWAFSIQIFLHFAVLEAFQISQGKSSKTKFLLFRNVQKSFSLTYMIPEIWVNLLFLKLRHM